MEYFNRSRETFKQASAISAKFTEEDAQIMAEDLVNVRLHARQIINQIEANPDEADRYQAGVLATFRFILRITNPDPDKRF